MTMTKEMFFELFDADNNSAFIEAVYAKNNYDESSIDWMAEAKDQLKVLAYLAGGNV